MTALTDHVDAPPAGDGTDPRALIEEARRLRRRRYLKTMVALAVVIVAIALGLAISPGGGHRGSGGSRRHHSAAAPHTTPPVAPRPVSPGVTLPSSGYFNQIVATSGGLLLSGVTPATAENPLPVCVSAPVDPTTLAVGKVRTGNCGDPRLFGQSVEVVNSPSLQSNNATISVNSLDPASGQVRYGSAVLTYSSYSDTHPVTASNAQWLWIYDVATTDGPELLQISEQSGAVAHTIAMPALYRPLLAASGGGVWVANSVGGSSAAALLYVPAGASTPLVVVPSTTEPICWLVGSTTGAWVGSGVNRCTTQVVQRFTDGSDTPLFTIRGTYLPFTVIGDESSGLWTMQYVSPNEEAIIRIDPDTGSERVVAGVPAVALPSYQTSSGLVPGQGAYLDGHLYLLEPPFHKNGYLGYASIVGVDVTGNG